MAEVVDAIVADLVLRGLDQYEAGFNRATEAHGRFYKSVGALKSQTFDLQAEGQKYKAGANAMAQAEEQSTQRIGRARKDRAASAKAADEAEVASAKRAADAVVAAEGRKQAAVEQTARKRGSVSVASDLFSDRPGSQRGSGKAIGSRSEPGSRAEAARQTAAMARITVPGAAAEEIAAEREVNHLLADQFDLRAKAAVAEGAVKLELKDQVSYLQRIATYRRAGLTDEQAAIRAEGELLAIEKLRTEQAEKQAVVQRAGHGGLGPANQFALQATQGRFGYSFSPGAIAGVAAAGAVAAGVAAVSNAVDFAKQIRDVGDATGLTTKQVQVYQAAAREAGVSNEQFASSVSHLNNFLGQAKGGNEQAVKTFAALGVSIKGAASSGDVLPALIDALTSIQDKSTRAAVEMRLFGESGVKLDAMLSGGNQKVNDLAAALERTGAVLSDSDIAKLDDTAKKLEQVKAQLQVEIASVVANNADAINKLADSFANLVNGIGKAVTAYERFANSPLGKGLDFADSQINPLRRAGSAAGAIIDWAGAPRGKAQDDEEARIKKGLSGVDDAFQRQRQAAASKVDQSALDKLFAPKGPKGKSADTLAAEAEARTKRFNDQLAGYQAEQLRAEAEATGDIGHRAALEGDIADLARKRQLDDIDSQRKIDLSKAPKSEADLINARAAILVEAVKARTVQDRDNRAVQLNADLANQQNELFQTRLDIERELLDGAQSSARTARDRLAIQLRLLEIEKQQERANLQNQIDTAKPGTDLAPVRARLSSLDERYAQRAANTRQQNAGPWASYADHLPRTARDIEEAFEQAAVNGVEAMNRGLGDAVAKALHLHGIAGQILNDFIQIAFKSAEAKLFGGGTGGNFSGVTSILGGIGKFLGIGGGSGIGSSIGGSFGTGSLLNGGVTAIDPATLGIPAFAGGGSFGIAGNGGIDRNVMSINGQPVARVNQGETVNIVPANMRAASSHSSGLDGRIHVSVETNDDVFTAKVTHISGAVSGAQIQAAAPRIAAGGASMANSQANRAARRRLGGN